MQTPLRDVLAGIRRARGLSQAQLAARIGVSRVRLCRWEGGRRRLDVLDAQTYLAALAPTAAELAEVAAAMGGAS